MTNFPSLSELNLLRSDGLRPVGVLSLSVLRSLDPAGIAGLEQLGITTLSELLHYEPVHRARVVMAVARGEIGHEVDLATYLDSPPASLEGIGARGTAAILGIGQSAAQVLDGVFDITTIAALAAFEPFREAEALLSEQSAAFSEAASAPDELIPRYRGSVAATRVRYSSFVREDSARLGLRMTSSAPILGPRDRDLAALFLGYRPGPGGPVVRESIMFRPDLGFAVLHEQSWVPLGLQLGDPIKSVGLIPGEVRKLAVVDWQQSLTAGRTEGTEAREQLNSLMVHQRALDEVVRTTAEEHQAGRTDTIAATGVGAAAGVASGALVGAIGGAVVGGLTGGVAGVPLGALLGLAGGGAAGGAAAAPTGEAAAPVTVPAGAAAGTPAGAGLGGLGGTLTGSVLGSAIGSLGGGAAAAIAGSLLGSVSGAIGHIESTSSGSRDIFGRLNQNITDVASQKASNIRSLRSSVVVDVTQSERESLATSVIANNNRAHALTVVYFELLSRYAVEIRTTRVDPLIYLPYSPLSFSFDLVAKYWHVLRLGIADANLVSEVDALLASSSFFDGTLDSEVGERAAPVLSRIEVSLVTSISVTGAEFKVRLLAGAREPEIPFVRVETLAGAGVKFSFRQRFSLPLGRVSGLRVFCTGVTAGVTVTAKVTSVDIDTGSDIETFDDVLSETHNFPPGVGAQDVDFAFSPLSLISESEQVQSSTQLVADRVVDLLNRRAYFFTRFVLSGIGPAEFEDLVESLVVGLPDLPGVRLTALIDPRPVGFVGGSVVFRLKRDPDLQQVVNMKTGVLPDLPGGRFDWVVPGFLVGNLTLKNFSLRLGAVRNSVLPFIDYIEEVARREAEEREAAAVRREIALPSPGVFAEAILGRSNAAEKIDPTRYIAWDLPNPNVAPEIAALVAGGRGLDVPDLSPSDTSGELGGQAPTQLPDPTGFAQAFGALASANLFRDMSGRTELADTLSRLADVAAQTASQAGSLAGNAQTAALDAASGLASKVADTVSKVNDTPKSLTEQGARLNAARNIDAGSGTPKQKKEQKKTIGAATTPDDPPLVTSALFSFIFNSLRGTELGSLFQLEMRKDGLAITVDGVETQLSRTTPGIQSLDFSEAGLSQFPVSFENNGSPVLLTLFGDVQTFGARIDFKKTSAFALPENLSNYLFEIVPENEEIRVTAASKLEAEAALKGEIDFDIEVGGDAASSGGSGGTGGSGGGTAAARKPKLNKNPKLLDKLKNVPTSLPGLFFVLAKEIVLPPITATAGASGSAGGSVSVSGSVSVEGTFVFQIPTGDFRIEFLADRSR